MTADDLDRPSITLDKFCGLQTYSRPAVCETAEIDSQLGANPWNLPPLISMAYILLITLTKFPALIRRRPSHEKLSLALRTLTKKGI